MLKRITSRWRPWLGGACAAVLLAAPLTAQQRDSVFRRRTVAEDLQLFSQVLNQIRVNHPDTVDMHDLFMAAIEGMVGAVDPHSYVLEARRLTPERERELRAGRLYPVPISFSFAGGAAVVVSVGSGTAAADQDILPGDELIAIEGTPITARSADELEIMLAGPRGSVAQLTFERQRLDGSLIRLTRAVKRQKGEDITAVPVAFLLDPQTGYVRITHFMNDHAARDLRKALGQLEDAGMKRLVLDLRDNPGGLLEEAANVAGEFLPRGALVYTSVGRHREIAHSETVSRSFLRADGGRPYPVAVLVNRGTASAAELLAGALQDHDRAIILGRPTFGKALLMQGFPLADGSTIMLVVGHVRTPCGRVIQRSYREITSREYYRLAGSARDTVGLPTCRSAAGRVLYGGDGIRPDTVLEAPAAPPPWVSALLEADVPLRWVGPYLESAPALPELAQFAAAAALPAQVLADFRAFAASQGVHIPEDADADATLRRTLLLNIATARWRAQGRYRVAAVLDPEVAKAAAIVRAGVP